MKSCVVPILITLISEAAGQGLFDCTHEEHVLLEGESRTVGECEMITCTRGSVEHEVCDAVPFGCTVIEKRRGLKQDFPDCCPEWCCGSECDGTKMPASNTPSRGPSASNNRGSTEDDIPIITLEGDPSTPTGGSKKPSRVTPRPSRRPQAGSSHGRPHGNAISSKPEQPSHTDEPDDDDTTSCYEDGRRIKSGQSTSASGCRRMDCKNGMLTTHFCQEVPRGCKIISEDKDKDFPACCPFWNCDDGTSGVKLTPGSLGRSCDFEGRSVRNGHVDYADDCRKVECTNGVLNIKYCNPTPAGCTEVSKDSRGRFPKCCPRFRCS